MMERRVFITGAVAAFSAPLAAMAQQAGRRIGFLGFTSPGIESQAIGALKARLEELGYVDGKNISIVYRWADWDRARFMPLAHELVQTGAHVITAACGESLKAVRRASATVPVVARCMGLREMGTEIRDGHQPTEHTTGVTYFVPSAITRRLQIVRELFPRASRLAILYRPESDWARRLDEVEYAARKLRFQVQRIAWRGQFASPLGQAARQDDVVLPMTDGWTFTQAEQLVEFINERRLAAVYDLRLFATHGGLASYGPDQISVYRKIGDQIARILSGERVANIPIDQPDRLELVINKATAKRMGLIVPPSLLARADQVIE